jgi:hypothetical protein
MRRFTAIARTAAVETMSQPLSAILFPAATLAVHLLPSLQYHRFGAPGRLARETGLSSLFVFGLIFAVPAAVKAIGRELESGTAAAALALGVSRSLFFTARVVGVLGVYALFAVGMLAASALSAFSCEKAASIVAPETVRVWGPAFIAGVSGSVMAFAGAAFLNRFFNRRFCLWTCILAVALQLPGLALLDGAKPVFDALPGLAALCSAGMVYVTIAAALAVRMKEGAVSACVAAAVAAGFFFPVSFLFPDMRVFWLFEGDGGDVAGIASGAALVLLWTLIGCVSLERREIP